MKDKTIVCNIGHVDNEIDIAMKQWILVDIPKEPNPSIQHQPNQPIQHQPNVNDKIDKNKNKKQV